MKLIVETATKNIDRYACYIDGIILGLKDFSVFNAVDYTIDEIRNIKEQYKNLDIFVKIDKNIFNNEIEKLKEILIALNDISCEGIFFYDIALLQLKKELHLDINLIWSQTHMVTNYRTCNYYLEKGCKYALVSKEITLDEIIQINEKSNINVMVEVLSLPSVAYSRRKLVTNYNHDIGCKGNNNLEIIEKITKSKYQVLEEKSGTGFILKDILNGTSVIKDLYENNINYIIFREYGINDFLQLIKDTKNYINLGCTDDAYIEKYKKLGDNTGFFFKKTIYKVR